MRRILTVLMLIEMLFLQWILPYSWLPLSQRTEEVWESVKHNTDCAESRVHFDFYKNLTRNFDFEPVPIHQLQDHLSRADRWDARGRPIPFDSNQGPTEKGQALSTGTLISVTSRAPIGWFGLDHYGVILDGPTLMDIRTREPDTKLGKLLRNLSLTRDSIYVFNYLNDGLLPAVPYRERMTGLSVINLSSLKQFAGEARMVGIRTGPDHMNPVYRTNVTALVHELFGRARWGLFENCQHIAIRVHSVGMVTFSESMNYLSSSILPLVFFGVLALWKPRVFDLFVVVTILFHCFLIGGHFAWLFRVPPFVMAAISTFSIASIVWWLFKRIF